MNGIPDIQFKTLQLERKIDGNNTLTEFTMNIGVFEKKLLT